MSGLGTAVARQALALQAAESFTNKAGSASDSCTEELMWRRANAFKSNNYADTGLLQRCEARTCATRVQHTIVTIASV